MTLAATVELSGALDGSIVLSGLKGSVSADDAAKNITSRSSPSHIASTGYWDGDADHPFGFGGFLGVELLHTARLPPGHEITFSFVLSNPSKQQVAQIVTATWSGVQGFRAAIMVADTAPLPLPGSVPGDAAPLLVYAPAFVLKSIRQSSVMPWAVNVIHVSLAANVELRGDGEAVVVIHGLSGSLTGRDAHWRVSPNTLALSYSAASLQMFGANASWTRETGQLELRLAPAAALPAGEVCAFSFEVRNPAANLSESDSIHVWLSSPAGDLAAAAMDRMPALLLNQSGAVAGDAIVLRSRAPGFMLVSLHQSTTFPG